MWLSAASESNGGGLHWSANILSQSGQITLVLNAISHGDRLATDRLMPLVYDEMRDVATAYMRQQPAGHTLHSTALVNEAYIKLCKEDQPDWKSRTHFFSAGAQAMRRILVDHARGKNRDKRGGKWKRVEFDEDLLGEQQKQEDILAIDEALTKLAKIDARQAKIVELRFFGGLTVAEVAEALDISKRTVELEWKMIRAWLRRELSGDSQS